MESVEQGLRYRSLTILQKSMGLSTSEIAKAVDISERTLARRKNEGRLKQEESERLVRISRVFDKTVHLFEGDEQEATRWLRKPARALGEKTPLNFASTEIGAREVENLIGRLEDGVFS
jgi:putative toxin-antitoxin system antitoxin component (TIGR02293 family)